MANGSERIAELLSTPMEAAIVGLAVGIARAQSELDRHSIQLQREIDEDPELADLGLHATWYQMPRAELELTMNITLEEDTSTPGALVGPLKASSILAQNRLHHPPRAGQRVLQEPVRLRRQCLEQAQAIRSGAATGWRLDRTGHDEPRRRRRPGQAGPQERD